MPTDAHLTNLLYLLWKVYITVNVPESISGYNTQFLDLFFNNSAAVLNVKTVTTLFGLITDLIRLK